jgi:hypothetical protein
LFPDCRRPGHPGVWPETWRQNHRYESLFTAASISNQWRPVLEKKDDVLSVRLFLCKNTGIGNGGIQFAIPDRD